jgi:hypothetical protein
VLKTEQSANEKVTLSKETSNQLFVQNIINIFAVSLISASGAFDSTFLCQKFYKPHKRPSLYIIWDVMAEFYSSSRDCARLYHLGTVILYATNS